MSVKTREMLNGRYDNLKSGKMSPISRDEVIAHFREKSDAARRVVPVHDRYDFHPEAAVDLDEIWEFIRENNLDAADRLIADILAAIDALITFP